LIVFVESLFDIDIEGDSAPGGCFRYLLLVQSSRQNTSSCRVSLHWRGRLLGCRTSSIRSYMLLDCTTLVNCSEEFVDFGLVCQFRSNLDHRALIAFEIFEFGSDDRLQQVLLVIILINLGWKGGADPAVTFTLHSWGYWVAWGWRYAAHRWQHV